MDESPMLRWRRIAALDVDEWNRRLQATDASLFQYPYWNEPLRYLHLVPRYLELGNDERGVAYTCLLTLGVPGARIGLVQRGPVALDHGGLPAGAMSSLATYARRRGYVFVRFTHSSSEVLDGAAALKGARRTDAFPFYREPSEELLVRQDGSDDDVLGRFQPIARRNIRQAEREGFRIESSSDPARLEAVWPLFEKLSRRKGFRFRPLDSFRDLIRLAASHGGARVYTASLHDVPVEAILVVRDGPTAHYICGALDVDALGGRDSPSVLLHWRAMRDFAREGTHTYDLGTRSGVVHVFKRKFRPLEVTHPRPITVVLNPPLYAVWSLLVLRLARGRWRGLKQAAARLLTARPMTRSPAGRGA